MAVGSILVTLLTYNAHSFYLTLISLMNWFHFMYLSSQLDYVLDHNFYLAQRFLFQV